MYLQNYLFLVKAKINIDAIFIYEWKKYQRIYNAFLDNKKFYIFSID